MGLCEMSKSFANKINRVICLFLLSYGSSLYILKMIPFSGIRFVNIFLYAGAYLFIFLFLFFFLKIFIYLFLDRGEGRKKERERNISVWLPLACPLLGTWPPAQPCALTGNRTGNHLACRQALNPLIHTSQGYFSNCVF